MIAPITKERRDRCGAALRSLVLSHEGISAAVLALRDGRPFVDCFRVRNAESGRFAAMVSSMAALGNTVMRELESGPMDHVLIDGGGGRLVISIIPDCNQLLLLAVLARTEVMLGAVLSHSRTCANRIAGIIASESAA